VPVYIRTSAHFRSPLTCKAALGPATPPRYMAKPPVSRVEWDPDGALIRKKDESGTVKPCYRSVERAGPCGGNWCRNRGTEHRARARQRLKSVLWSAMVIERFVEPFETGKSSLVRKRAIGTMLFWSQP
jgi:hypothetical protein